MFISICVPIGPSEKFQDVITTIDSIEKNSAGEAELVIKVYNLHLRDEIKNYVRNLSLKVSLLDGSDKGIYDAFNICARAAEGDFLIFLGCGDEFLGINSVENITENKKYINSIVFYAGVKIWDGKVYTSFDNRCFFGQRRLLPWRNPCHSQGLIYRRDWFIKNMFSTDVGPLADLIHTYTHKIYAVAVWLDFDIAIFKTGGISNSLDRKAFGRQLFGVYKNCDNFKFSLIYRQLSFFVCNMKFYISLFNRKFK